MWLDKKRIAQVVKDNDMTYSEVAIELGLTLEETLKILEGKKSANRKQAEILLNLFGIWNICWAMKDNWRWMRYAIEAILAN